MSQLPPKNKSQRCYPVCQSHMSKSLHKKKTALRFRDNNPLSCRNEPPHSHSLPLRFLLLIPSRGLQGGISRGSNDICVMILILLGRHSAPYYLIAIVICPVAKLTLTCQVIKFHHHAQPTHKGGNPSHLQFRRLKPKTCFKFGSDWTKYQG